MLKYLPHYIHSSLAWCLRKGMMKEGPSVLLGLSAVAGGRKHDNRTDAGLEKQKQRNDS